MGFKSKETKAFAEAVYFEANKVYFSNKLPLVPEVKFRKYPKNIGKYKGIGKIVVNGHYIFMSTDSPEERVKKMELVSQTVRHNMVHMCQELVGKRPIHTRTFDKIAEQMDNCKLAIIDAGSATDDAEETADAGDAPVASTE
jgi:hypothetical protein